MNKKELWLKLKNYHFDHIVPPHLGDRIIEIFGGADASTKAFAGKIARKSGWTNDFAAKALFEYKKFVYLGVVSDFNVTPSKVIDQVWHEHLLFTSAYRQFCNEVIYYTLDHNPELVPMTDQTGNFNAQYLETLELYKKEFGFDPPADIWSIPKFDEQRVAVAAPVVNRKQKNNSGSDTVYADTPLIAFFGDSQYGSSPESFSEFSGFGGGDSGGGGATGGWGDNNSDASSNSDSSGDSGGDSGGCSSGCGGGD